MSDSVDRDFNTDRPKTFQLRDEVFRIRPVRPEAYAEAIRREAEIEAEADTTLEQLFAGWDTRILLSIDAGDGAHDRWRALRARDDENGVEMADLIAIRDWLTEVHTGRPTRPAEPSSVGPGNAEASSTARGSSRAVTRAA